MASASVSGPSPSTPRLHAILPERWREVGHTKLSRADGACVVYWMLRDFRAANNWALLQAQNMATQTRLPLRVCVTLPMQKEDQSERMRAFQVEGLREVERDLRGLGIPVHLVSYDGTADETASRVVEFCRAHQAACVVCDFHPLRLPRAAVTAVAAALDAESPAVPLQETDARNVVPCWHAYPKQAYGAMVLRRRIMPLLRTFLTRIPRPRKASKADRIAANPSDARATWDADLTAVLAAARPGVAPVTGMTGGATAGSQAIEVFLRDRLPRFATHRNNPLVNGQSGLSPWLHHGHISAQDVVRRVVQSKAAKDNVEAFVEECVVRRELSDNFCHYNARYDSLDGAEAWARRTLDEHRADPRHTVYTYAQLDSANTSDPLWNAAQRQMKVEGKMHGFMRMYWAKKILEWSPSPEEALAWSNQLNDTYSLDGRDPNGYVGCAWSVMGTHDRAWTERPIFGKIRYMNYNGCKRKFKVGEYEARYASV